MGNELVLLHKIGKTTSAEFVTLVDWIGDAGYRYRANELYYVTDWLGGAGQLEVEIKINGKIVDIPPGDAFPVFYMFLLLNGRLILDSMPHFQLRFKSDGTNLVMIDFFMSMIKEKRMSNIGK